MAKGRVMNYRQQAKRSSTIALVLSMLLMLSVVLLMLLALGILSLPVSDSDVDSNPISNHFKFNRKFINHNNHMYVCLLLLYFCPFGGFHIVIVYMYDLFDAVLIAMYRNLEMISGLKFFLGSLELFSIITFW